MNKSADFVNDIVMVSRMSEGTKVTTNCRTASILIVLRDVHLIKKMRRSLLKSKILYKQELRLLPVPPLFHLVRSFPYGRAISQYVDL